MWKINGEYTTIMDAKVDYCKSKGWGMNEAALEVFNTITSGVRDGWFFPIRRQKLDEVIFLQWVEELRLVLKPLGLFAEPGVYLRRRPKMVKGKTIVDAKRRLPARLVSHFVVFVAGDSESLSALSDAYYLARGAKGRMFEPDAYAHPEQREKAEMVLAALLGISDQVVKDQTERGCKMLSYVCVNLHQFPKEMYDQHPWSKHICWYLHDDPFDMMFPSVSRSAAMACYEAMKNVQRWRPWTDEDGEENSPSSHDA